MSGVLSSKGLNDVLRVQIRDLDAVCSAAEPLSMKLNWDMLETRPADETNDLLWYEDGRLLGYLGLYGFGKNPAEIEITGMVHPEARRRGIFSRLFGEAVTLCHARGAGRLLLIAERQSDSGAAFAKSRGLVYDFSEYRMLCTAYRPAQLIPPGFSQRPADRDDTSFIDGLDETCFGQAFSDSDEGRLERLSIACLDGQRVGKIGLTDEGDLGYVFGVAVLPEYRGRGIGRAMLDGVLKRHFDSRSTPVILEVAVKNDNALTLYQSCGFAEATIYDYYEMTLRGGERR